MKKFILRMSSSLSARIIILVVFSQLAILVITALVQANTNAKFYKDVATQTFGYNEVSILYNSLFTDEGKDYTFQNSKLESDRFKLWEHILQENPEFRYVREREETIVSGSEIPLNYEEEKARFSNYEINESKCTTTNQNRGNSYINLLKCPGKPLSGIGFSGLKPDYVPVNNSYIYGVKTILVPKAVLWSYGLILLLTPFLVYFLILPLRKASKTAQQISPSTRGLQISKSGIFLEARGFVTAINDALRRLDLGYQRETEFRNAIAHELKTPLTILRARIDLVKDKNLQNRLVIDVTKLSALIDRLLEFAKNSAEPKDLEQINLKEVVQEACEHCGDVALANGHKINYSPCQERVIVHADRTAIFLAITNLLNNAIKHSQAQTPIQVNVTKNGCIEIIDNGIGFKIDQKGTGLDSFEVFTLQSPSGRGLGLNIARQAVALSKGRISCESSEGQGTKYIVSFPLFRMK